MKGFSPIRKHCRLRLGWYDKGLVPYRKGRIEPYNFLGVYID
jgi:hypothetical protein